MQTKNLLNIKTLTILFFIIIFLKINLTINNGGEGGIRTLGTVLPIRFFSKELV